MLQSENFKKKKEGLSNEGKRNKDYGEMSVVLRRLNYAEIK